MTAGTRRGLGAIATAVTAIAMGITATSALAASTRAEYVAQADPICQPGLSQQKTIVRRAVKRLKRLTGRRTIDLEHPSKVGLRLAVRLYDQVAGIERGVDSQLMAIPPAPGDEATVTPWLQGRAAFTNTLQRSAHVLAHHNLGRFRKLIRAAIGYGIDADYLVRDFGFASCNQIFPGLV